MHLSLLSPAKINLNLQILNQREDGYHNLKSEFLAIDLCDKITLTPLTEGIQLITMGKYKIPNNRDNLAYQIAEKLRPMAQGRVGVKIEIEKNIPLFAGLGGGSSNAATVLKGLNQLWNLNLSIEKQIVIGQKIGTDIPFFLIGQHCLVEGVGEKITPLNTFPKNKYILIAQLPYIRIATPWAYAEWDKYNNHANLSGALSTKSPKNRNNQKNTNDFEKIIFPRFPDLTDLKEVFLELGATQAGMTGSGSVIFGIFENKQKAKICLQNIEPKCEFSGIFRAF